MARRDGGEQRVAEKVRTEFGDGIAVFTIDRPEAKNAVDLAVAEALAAAIDEAAVRDRHHSEFRLMTLPARALPGTAGRP